MFHQDLGLVKLLRLSRLSTTVSLHDSSRGLNLLLFCFLILLALRPSVSLLSGISRHGFVHLTLLPFPDFIPQRNDALAHEFDLAAHLHLHSFFIGPSYRLIRLFLRNLLLNLLEGLFNGPLYIPVVPLALLTEERTARGLPKQRWSKKKVGSDQAKHSAQHQQM